MILDILNEYLSFFKDVIMKNIIVVFMLALLISGCSSVQLNIKEKVKTEVGFDFSSKNSFYVAYKKTNETGEFTKADIAKLLQGYFENKGYTPTHKKDADFYLLIHYGIKCANQIEKDYESMDVYPRFKHDLKPIVVDGKAIYKANPYTEPIGTPIVPYTEDKKRRYKNNMLLIEILDTETNKIVWQGFVKNELSLFKTKEEKEVYINEVFEKLFKGFPDHK